jgi:predicted MFS family arabinose efflux permease
VHLLRQPRLALLFAGGALNAIGSWATLIALWGFAAYKFHTGPEGIAMLGLAWNVPGAVIGPFAGAPIDRFGPKVIMASSDLAGMATAIAMAFASSYATLVALAVAAGVVQSVARPASTSLVPRIVDRDQLLAGNSLMGVAQQSAIVFGPLAGSVAINAWGIKAAFIFDAATFLVGVVTVLPLRLRPLDAQDDQTSAGRDLLAGWRIARSVRDVRHSLLLAGAVFCSWGAFVVIEPLYVRDVLHRSPATLGFLQTVFGIGLIGTTALLPRIGDRVVSVRALAIAVTASGAAAAVYVGTKSLVVAMAGVFIWGVDVAFFMPPMQTVLQRSTPADAHGRVMALAATVNGVGNLVAIPLTGFIIGAVGVSHTGSFVGLFAAAAGIAAFAVTANREPASPVATSQPATVGAEPP